MGHLVDECDCIPLSHKLRASGMDPQGIKIFNRYKNFD